MKRRVQITSLALTVVAATVIALVPPASAAATMNPSITVSATRSAAGSHLESLPRRTTSHRAVWKSGKGPAGIVLTTRFSVATPVDGMRIQGAGSALRIRDARIEFSDGSSVSTTTTAVGSRSIAFPSRRVHWVRLVVAGMRAGQAEVGLAGWWFHRGSSSRSARAPGNIGAHAKLSASSGQPTSQGWTAAHAGSGQWLQMTWKRARELSAVRIYGDGAADTSITTGYLKFSDGSRVIVGSLEPRGGAPTTIAFTPRMTKVVRFVVTSIPKGVRAKVRRVAAWTVGSIPPEPAVKTPTFSASGPAARSCANTTGSPSAQLILLCPSNGSRLGTSARLVVSGPVGARLVVVAHRPNGGSATRRVAAGRVTGAGLARLTIPMRLLANGPTAVRITASGVSVPLYVQFENTSGLKERVPRETVTRGMDLKFDENFNSPLSVTRTGADATYASGKPNSYGVDDFGDAIFAQPTSKERNIGTSGGFLRIRSRALTSQESDPAGYGRRYIGGLISSAHMGGSGFSAQHGYFEARILGPAGAGTWPAFWLLSTGSLTPQIPHTGEIDATELYGANPAGACQTTHSWTSRATSSGRAFCLPLADRGDFALEWHTYGALVTSTGTTFYIDGRISAQTRAVVDADEPFFFLANLALGGGFPVDLRGTQSQATMYVDSVKVWV